MFEYKNAAQIAAMTDEQRNNYAEEKRKHEKALMDAAIKAGLDPLDLVIKAHEQTVKDLQKELDETKEKVNSVIDATDKGLTLGDINEAVSKFITENAEKITQLKRAGSGNLTFMVLPKAVASITAGNQVITSGGNTGTAGSATNPDGIPQLVGVQMAPPSRVNLRTSMVDGLVSSFQTSLASYPYTESIPKEGDAAFTAEGAAKAQIDFKFETRYANPVKATAYVRLTDESLADIPGLMSVATGFLKDKHDLRRMRGILYGDGVSPNPKGATVYGRAFVVGTMANSVRFANFMDVVNACITDIYVTHNFTDEMPYMASLVMVNPVDFYTNLVSAKDERGLPLFPQAGLFNQVTIGGVTIIPEETIPAGKIFVADMSKYNVSNYVGYTVKIGWVNDDFIKNQFVMLGESRFHAYVKHLDQQAFIYDDIATIKAAISTVV